MADELVQYDVQAGVATITLNRADKYNSFTRELAFALHEALDTAKTQEEVRAILLTGQGKAFCAGQDLAEAIDLEGPGLSAILEKHLNPIITRLREIPLPVVAAVNGVAAGAGVSIALACDITVAAASAKFIQAFSKIGLIPDSGATYHLPRLIGWQRASALMMLGDPITATEAVQMGLIYRAIPDADFSAEAGALAQRLAQMPTHALALTKRALNYALTNDLANQLILEEHLQVEASQTADYAEGVAAFLEKRKPTFVGK